jgi:hypothetical protein
MNRLDANPYLNLALQGRVFRHVDGATGSDARRRAPNRAYATIQGAIDAASPGDALLITPPGQVDGSATGYDETVTIPASLSNLVLIGLGGRGSAFIEPSTEDAAGLICHADDVALINLGVAAEDTTAGNYALTVTGDRFRATGCKLEGGEYQFVIGPGTNAQITAGTHGKGADCLLDDCELTWGTGGVLIKASDYGAVTELRVRDSLFRNLSASAFEETGGTASIRFRNLLIQHNTFCENEGAPPTKYISLNDDNTNDGLVVDNFFQTALNGGLNLVSTSLIWGSNRHPAGLSTGQPS